MNAISPSRKAIDFKRQRGVATLFVALVLLIVLTIIVLFSLNTAVFEQRTTLNENRARLVEQAAEYTINLAGEYLKGKRNVIISKVSGSTTTGGWLSTSTSTGRKWALCPTGTLAATHPCNAERNLVRRAKLYFYSEDGGTTASALPYRDLTPGPAELETATVGVGGNSRFVANTEVRALLCRIDSSLSTPACIANPVTGNRIAVTLIAEVTLPGEASSSVIKETWATYSASLASSAAPIVASGAFNGSGNVDIVTSPNGAGYGLPVSIWTSADAQVENTTGGGTASVSSCFVGDFMQGSSGEGDLDEAKTICPQGSSTPPCHCPKSKDDKTVWLSGHPTGGDRRENIDILDRDGGACVAGSPCPPDVQFYPGGGWSNPATGTGTLIPLDVAGVLNDDSLFEWIFGVSNVVADRDATGQTLHNCGAGTQDCADYALRETLNATVVSDCSAFNATTSGLYYVTGNCSITGTVGAKGSPAIIVVFGTGGFGSSAVLYGMLFLHSDNIAADNASACPSDCKFDMQGGTVFGSIVIEGDIKMGGNPVIVYDDVSTGADPYTLPASAKFARVTGSWLDSRTGF